MDQTKTLNRNRVLRVLTLGAVAIIVFDTIAATFSRVTSVPYEWLTFGSLLILLVFGFWIGRIANWGLGALSGSIIGFTDATVGWTISWSIGPGKPQDEITGLMIVVAVLFVSCVGAIVGLIGGSISLLFKSNA